RVAGPRPSQGDRKRCGGGAGFGIRGRPARTSRRIPPGGAGLRQTSDSSSGRDHQPLPPGGRPGGGKRPGARPRARADARFHARAGAAVDAETGGWAGPLGITPAELAPVYFAGGVPGGGSVGRRKVGAFFLVSFFSCSFLSLAS